MANQTAEPNLRYEKIAAWPPRSLPAALIAVTMDEVVVGILAAVAGIIFWFIVRRRKEPVAQDDSPPKGWAGCDAVPAGDQAPLLSASQGDQPNDGPCSFQYRAPVGSRRGVGDDGETDVDATRGCRPPSRPCCISAPRPMVPPSLRRCQIQGNLLQRSVMRCPDNPGTQGAVRPWHSRSPGSAGG